MSLVAVVLLLGLLGAFVGFFLGVLTKKRRSHPLDPVERLSEAELRRLIQLKGQLESGLITKEEYRAEREKLLKT